MGRVLWTRSYSSGDWLVLLLSPLTACQLTLPRSMATMAVRTSRTLSIWRRWIAKVILARSRMARSRMARRVVTAVGKPTTRPGALNMSHRAFHLPRIGLRQVRVHSGRQRSLSSTIFGAWRW